MLGDLTTYTVTAGQLALAFPDPVSGIVGSFVKFAGVFALTQLPLAVVEGLLTVVIVNFLREYSGDELQILEVLAANLAVEARYEAHQWRFAGAGGCAGGPARC